MYCKRRWVGAPVDVDQRAARLPGGHSTAGLKRAAGQPRSRPRPFSCAVGILDRFQEVCRRSPDGARVWVRSVAWVSPSGPVTQDRTARRLRAVVDAEDCGTIWRAPGISCRLTGERSRGLAGSSIVVLADALS